MIPDPPPGQGPIDPRGAFSPPGSPLPSSGPPGAPAPGPSFNPPPINLPPGFSRGFPSMPAPQQYQQYPQYPQFMMQPPRRRASFVRSVATMLLTVAFGISLL